MADTSLFNVTIEVLHIIFHEQHIICKTSLGMSPCCYHAAAKQKRTAIARANLSVVPGKLIIHFILRQGIKFHSEINQTCYEKNMLCSAVILPNALIKLLSSTIYVFTRENILHCGLWSGTVRRNCFFLFVCFEAVYPCVFKMIVGILKSVLLYSNCLTNGIKTKHYENWISSDIGLKTPLCQIRYDSLVVFGYSNLTRFAE